MGPDELRAWEPILQSPVAVALLLFAELVVVGSVSLTIIGRLLRKIDSQQAQMLAWLDADRAVRHAADQVIIRSLHATTAPDHATPPLPAGPAAPDRADP